MNRILKERACRVGDCNCFHHDGPEYWMEVDGMSKEYGMFSKGGNARVHTLVEKVIKMAKEDKYSDRILAETVREGIEKIAATKLKDGSDYGEVTDTDVRDHIYGTILNATGKELED